MKEFVVVCTDEGVYCLATRQVFTSKGAAETYAATIGESRKPLVIGGRWSQLRFPGILP